jgi:glycosyltransferase involved in cell wall biosynthesis
MIFTPWQGNHNHQPKLSVMMLGFRGFPGVQGGVESHMENLCPLLVQGGVAVTAIVRNRYMKKIPLTAWKGVTLTSIWAPRSIYLEALVHSFLGVIVAAFRRPDVLHIHGIGPALVTPFARLLRLRVVVTHHGPDYDREKWGALARRILRIGESFGMHASHRRIAISRSVEALVKERYGKACAVIPNGIRLPDIPSTSERLAAFRLVPGRYVLTVGRLVPEKRQHDLIAAFTRAHHPGWKLAIVGDFDHVNPYADRLAQLAAETPDVVLTGFQTGETLRELFAHAGLFVLPSSHEGLPIALLEALSYGLPVLASDIRANLEIGLRENGYFPVTDVDALAIALESRINKPPYDEEERNVQRRWVAQRFDWDDIAYQTMAVYRDLTRVRRQKFWDTLRPSK